MHLPLHCRFAPVKDPELEPLRISTSTSSSSSSNNGWYGWAAEPRVQYCCRATPVTAAAGVYGGALPVEESPQRHQALYARSQEAAAVEKTCHLTRHLAVRTARTHSARCSLISQFRSRTPHLQATAKGDAGRWRLNVRKTRYGRKRSSSPPCSGTRLWWWYIRGRGCLPRRVSRYHTSYIGAGLGCS